MTGEPDHALLQPVAVVPREVRNLYQRDTVSRNNARSRKTDATLFRVVRKGARMAE